METSTMKIPHAMADFHGMRSTAALILPYIADK
jgi:hypothetical protein